MRTFKRACAKVLVSPASAYVRFAERSSFGYGEGRLMTAATPDATTTFHFDAFGQVNMTVQSMAAGSSMAKVFVRGASQNLCVQGIA